MVSTRPFIFKFSSSCTNPLVTVPSVPVTTGITVTFMSDIIIIINSSSITILLVMFLHEC